MASITTNEKHSIRSTLRCLKEYTTEAKRVVLLGIDDSSFSQSVVEWTIDNFSQSTDLLVLTTAIPTQDIVETFYASQLAGVDIIPSELDRLADKLLERYAAKFATIGHPQLAAYIVVGDPRKSLIEASTDLKADLLVIGSRGLSKLQGMVLGSVSEYCVQHSKVPVLVTKLESKTASTSSK